MRTFRRVADGRPVDARLNCSKTLNAWGIKTLLKQAEYADQRHINAYRVDFVWPDLGIIVARWIT